MSDYPLTDSIDILLRFTGFYDTPEAGEPLFLNFGNSISPNNLDIVTSVSGSDITIFETDYPLQRSVDILLRFINPYETPEPGDSITLRFGTIGSLEIISKTSDIRIIANQHTVSGISVVASDTLNIRQSFANHEVEVIREIYNASVKICITSSNHLVEHLPDIVSNDAVIDVLFQASSIGGGQPNDLPMGLSTGGLRSSWFKAQNEVGRDFVFPWAGPDNVVLKNRALWETSKDIVQQTKAPFDVQMDKEDSRIGAQWGQFENHQDRKTEAPFIGIMSFFDKFETAKWDKQTLRDKKTVNNYKNTMGINGDFKDRHVSKKWDKSLYYDKHKRNDFKNNKPGSITDKHHGTYWGPYWYSLWCQEKYFPYLENEDIKLVLKTDVPPLISTSFVEAGNARCPFAYWYTGNRDSFKPIIIPSDQLFTERKKVYYMLNSAFIKRISDSADIHFKSVSMSIDRDSWTWDFNITLMTRDALELIRPVNDTLIDIEININGWKWTCRVENWSESVSFGQRAWTVSGRSPSVELGEPYLVESAFSNAEGHGGQVVDDILEYTGWSATWSHDDFNPHMEWLIPAATLNLYDSSKIQQIQSIVQAVGAFIQTVPDTNAGQGFVIHPTYKRNPWNWGSQITPTVFLNDAVCHEYGRSNNIIKPVNSVIVSGENAGIIIDATRDGTAGDSPAAMIIDSLITSQEAGVERARHEIGKTGFWINHSMRLFSLMPPGGAPGLMLPGTFINMSETGFTAWIGQVTGTQISAAWSNSLEVSQQIEVEQFYG